MSFSARATVTAATVAHGPRSATLEDFRAHAPSGTYVFMPCRETWAARAVDIVVGPQKVFDKNGKPVRNKKGELVTESASAWLLKHQRVEQMAWIPGQPALIHDRLLVDGGWIERPEVTCLNMYRPPRIELGDARLAGPWITHVKYLFSDDDADHILDWLAQQKHQRTSRHLKKLAGESAPALQYFSSICRPLLVISGGGVGCARLQNARQFNVFCIPTGSPRHPKLRLRP